MSGRWPRLDSPLQLREISATNVLTDFPLGQPAALEAVHTSTSPSRAPAAGPSAISYTAKSHRVVATVEKRPICRQLYITSIIECDMFSPPRTATLTPSRHE